MHPFPCVRFVFVFAAAISLLASCDSGSNSSNSDPISTGNSGSTIPWNSSITYGSLTYAGQTYKTVVIGTQTWMAENLNVEVDSSWCFADRVDSCSKYGRLYQWSAAMGLDSSYNSKDWSGTLPHQGICPTGWHMPSDSEWTNLANYLGGASIAGEKLKSCSGWFHSGVLGNGADTYGFRALPAGDRDGYVGDYATFWSSSESSRGAAWLREMDLGRDDLDRGNNDKYPGYSVRCLKD